MHRFSNWSLACCLKRMRVKVVLRINHFSYSITANAVAMTSILFFCVCGGGVSVGLWVRASTHRGDVIFQCWKDDVMTQKHWKKLQQCDDSEGVTLKTVPSILPLLFFRLSVLIQPRPRNSTTFVICMHEGLPERPERFRLKWPKTVISVIVEINCELIGV